MPLITLLMASLAIHGQDKVLLRPDVGLDRKVAYTLHIVEHLDSTDADVNAAYSEGPAKDSLTPWLPVEIAYSAYSITAGGQDIPAPMPSTHTIHFDRRGNWEFMEIEELTSVSRFTPDLLVSLLYGDTIKIGQQHTSNGKDYRDPKSSFTITANLDQIKDDVATITCKFSIITSKFDSPLNVQMKVLANASSGTLQSAEGDVTSIPPQIAGRYNVQSAHFELKRVP